MDVNYTNKLNQILQYSKEEALRLRNDYIGPEHIMLGILRDGENKAYQVLESSHNVDMTALKKKIESILSESSHLKNDDSNITLNDKSRTILNLCVLESRLLRSKQTDVEHLLLAIMKQKNNIPATILNDNDISYSKLFKMIKENAPIIKDEVGYDDEEEDTPPSSKNKDGLTNRKVKTGNSERGGGHTDTPAIDSFSFDLTKAAQDGLLDPVVGREKEIERLAQILNRKKKNNPILIGEPGVGKSAIVEGLAQRIVQRKVSRSLFGKRVVSLDITSIVAGTKFRGQFEERMKAIINELKSNPNIIVFIDEIHMLVGAGNASGEMDAANMLKPALSRGELQCIGATTLSEFRKSIEKDGALDRRFQKIIVDPTTPEETCQILHNIKERYEEHHNVSYTDEAIEACVYLTERYITDRHFPDKAIDALDEVGSRVHINNISVPKEIEDQEIAIQNAIIQQDSAVKNQNYELAASYRDRVKQLQQELEEKRSQWEASQTDTRVVIDYDQVAETVAMMSGVPSTRMAKNETIRIKGMRTELKEKVIAQDSAIDTMVSAIQRNRIGLNDPNRPIGTFMFIGPTGVGKTYLAKQLAEFMFGSSDALIRIDMSEYMEKFNASRLVGAPPGYVGYDEGGQLTEKVRRKPYSIVLFDEIEKAHPDVFNILLQIMDDGRLTDSFGRTVDFRNTIIIMTSNAGTRQLKDFGNKIGFSSVQNDTDDKMNSRRIVRKALERQFSPEFLNRIDDIITFDQLDKTSILKIIDIELKKLLDRIEKLGYHLNVDDTTKNYIAEIGYDKQYGARPLRRAIQNSLETLISEQIVEGNIPDGANINAVYDNTTKKITLSITEACSD